MDQSPFLGVYINNEGKYIRLLNGEEIAIDKVPRDMMPFYGVFYDIDETLHDLSEISGSGGGGSFPDAPHDGKQYARQGYTAGSMKWEEVKEPWGDFVEDTVVNLIASTPISIPIAKKATPPMKIMAFIENDTIPYIEGVDITNQGNSYLLTPRQSQMNAKIRSVYTASLTDIPKDISTFSVDFQIDQANTEVLNAITLITSDANTPVRVDWGDGNVETVVVLLAGTSTSFNHTYVNAGVYTVVVTEEYGFINACRYQLQNPKVVSKLNVYKSNSVNSLGSLLTNHNIRLISFKENFKFETPNIVTLTSTFENAYIDRVPNGIFDLLTKNTNLSKTFDKSQIMELQTGLFDNMPFITTTAAMARQCPRLATVGEALLKDKKFLTNGGQLFQGCTALTYVGDELYSGCSALTTVQSVFENTGNFEVFPNLFKGCIAVTTLASLFYLSKITALPDGLYRDMLEVTDITALHRTGNAVLAIPDDYLVNQTKITKMNLAFNGMTSCVYIPETLMLSFQNVLTDMTSAFQGSTQFGTQIDKLMPSIFPALITATSAFYGCSKLTGNALPIINVQTLITTAHATMFKNCTSLSDYANPALVGWK